MEAATQTRNTVEFYTIQLSQLPDGAVFIDMTAVSVDDKEPQLLSQEIASGRYGSLDAALTTIRQAVGASSA